MIHQLLQLTRPLIVLDLETTSLDVQTARIIEIGFQLWESTGLTKEWRSLVNPGIPIPAASTTVHHITDRHMLLCQTCQQPAREMSVDAIPIETDDVFCACDQFKRVPLFAELASSLAKGFAHVDFCGKNVRYDLRVLSAEFARVNIEWSYLNARIIDADRLEALGEPRTLGALYRKHLGQPLADAHHALVDVRATSELIVAQLQCYQQLPRDLDALHRAQWPGWIDSDGKFRFVDGVACCTFGKWNGKAMHSIERSYWDWILGADFSADVKALARDAKLGKFPVAK